jgi:NAD/NADP transhydrogenase beta subunit
MAYITHVKGLLFVLAIGGLFFLKVKFNLNKYLMWAAFTIGYYLLMARLAVPAGGAAGGAAGEL